MLGFGNISECHQYRDNQVEFWYRGGGVYLTQEAFHLYPLGTRPHQYLVIYLHVTANTVKTTGITIQLAEPPWCISNRRLLEKRPTLLAAIPARLQADPQIRRVPARAQRYVLQLFMLEPAASQSTRIIQHHEAIVTSAFPFSPTAECWC